MAFPRKLLNDNEQLILDLRPHWWFIFKPVASLVVAIIIGIVILATVDGSWAGVSRGAAGILLLVTLVFFLYKFAIWTTTNFVLTSDRVVSRKGVLSKQGIEIPLERINTVFFHQGPFERIIGAGDLTIESAGESGSEPFTDIRHPSMVQREIYVQMEANENRKYDRVNQNIHTSMANHAEAARGAGLSNAEQIEKLHALYQSGALTQEQFEAEKAKLLAS